MKNPKILTLLLVVSGVLASMAHAEGTRPLTGSVEAGAFYHALSNSQADWQGQSVVSKLRAFDWLTAQLELVNTDRGGDVGQLGGLTLWADLHPNLFTVVSASGSRDAQYYADWRSDAELHLKIPGAEETVLFGGGGRADFGDADSWIATSGITRYFPLGGPLESFGSAAIGYRWTFFDNDFGPGSARGNGGTTHSHLGQVMLGDEGSYYGQFDLTYMFGRDVIRDFAAITNNDANLQSHVVYVGWRRYWTDRLGTNLKYEWGRLEDTYTRHGVYAGLIWRFGELPIRRVPDHVAARQASDRLADGY